MSIPPGQKQQCPICGYWVDISHLADGQRVRCHCGINFIVRKSSAPSEAELAEFLAATSPKQPPESEGDKAQLSEPKTEISRAPQNVEAPTIPETAAEPVTERAHAAGPFSDSGVQIQRLRETLQDKKQPAQPQQQAPAQPKPPQAAQQRRAPAVTAPMPAIPVFEGYTIVERLGHGGMGEVWKARRNSDGLLVAIKVLASEYANDESLVVRFEKEVAALATLDHPGIVKLVGRDFRRKPPFFAMELCDGQTLRERMGSPSFSLRQRLVVFSELCRVLAHAHERGVVHRDLKPDNVLFDARGRLKLIDFGLAALINGDERYQLTQFAMTMGTADYMPPEQRRDAKSVDARGDVWSLGIMLYELLSGVLPQGQFKPLTERMPGLDPRIDTIIQRALIPDREKRLQSASEMAAAVDQVIFDMDRPRPKTDAKSSLSPLDMLRGFLRKKGSSDR